MLLAHPVVAVQGHGSPLAKAHCAGPLALASHGHTASVQVYVLYRNACQLTSAHTRIEEQAQHCSIPPVLEALACYGLEERRQVLLGKHVWGRWRYGGRLHADHGVIFD